MLFQIKVSHTVYGTERVLGGRGSAAPGLEKKCVHFGALLRSGTFLSVTIIGVEAGRGPRLSC